MDVAWIFVEANSPLDEETRSAKIVPVPQTPAVVLMFRIQLRLMGFSGTTLKIIVRRINSEQNYHLDRIDGVALIVYDSKALPFEALRPLHQLKERAGPQGDHLELDWEVRNTAAKLPGEECLGTILVRLPQFIFLTILLRANVEDEQPDRWYDQLVTLLHQLPEFLEVRNTCVQRQDVVSCPWSMVVAKGEGVALQDCV